MNAPSFPPTLAERSARLKGLYERLRTNHFGIDAEIQRLLDAFAPWYQFAETQTRPRAIGLWGMTGTGKSSLVRALVKEIGMEDRTYWLDAGALDRYGAGVEYVARRIEEHLNGAPFIIVVDEFQHARTMKEGESVGESTDLRRFWELLDSGRIVTWPDYSRDKDINDFQLRFKQCVQAGVRVRKGRIVSNYIKFQNIMRGRRISAYDSNEPDDWGVPIGLWGEFQRMHFAPQPTLLEIENRLSTMSERNILDWIEELRTNGQRVHILDASKILVILLGNLDELYVGGKEPMAELDPEVLLHRHRDIGRAGVQHALLKLFRIEQVGRIGSSHVVFPPIGKHTIDAIVQQEVRGLSGRLSAHCGRRIEVDAELVDYLRSTSSIAVLGARPVVEAVQNTVPLLLSQVVEHPKAARAKVIRLGVSEGLPVAELELGKRRQRVDLAWDFQPGNVPPSSNSKVERIAVHETGHLLCGVLLCGKRPLQVCARTRDPKIGGFVVWDVRPEQATLRSDIVPELAGLLAGRMAEQMYYGPDAVSTGAEDDLRRATAMALDMVKSAGMGQHIFQHTDHPTSEHRGFRTMLHEVEAQAKQWIEAAEALALDTLQEHKALFDKCMEALKERGSLGMAELAELLKCEGGAAYLGTFKIERT